MFVNLILLPFACTSTKSAELDLDSLGVTFTVYSGESSTGFSEHQDEADLVAGDWALMKGDSGQTVVEAHLWTPDSIPFGQSGIDLEYWGDVRLAKTDEFEVTNSGESVSLENVGPIYPGQVVGLMEQERSGLFSLRFMRDGSVVAPGTLIFLAQPSLDSHSEDGEVELVDEILSFDLVGLDELAGDPDGWYASNWWLVVLCGEEHIFSGTQYDIGVEELPDSKLIWDLGEVYDTLMLEETAECELTLTEHNFGELDPAFGGRSGSLEGFYTENFNLTFKVD